MAPLTNQRGRPKGRSALNAGDDRTIKKVVETLANNPKLTMSNAIVQQLGRNDTSGLRRLQRKIAQRGGCAQLVAEYKAQHAVQRERQAEHRTATPNYGGVNNSSKYADLLAALGHSQIGDAISQSHKAMENPVLKLSKQAFHSPVTDHLSAINSLGRAAAEASKQMEFLLPKTVRDFSNDASGISAWIRREQEERKRMQDLSNNSLGLTSLASRALEDQASISRNVDDFQSPLRRFGM